MERRDVPLRMIEIISPAGFENFLHELSELVAVGPPDSPKLGLWPRTTALSSANHL